MSLRLFPRHVPARRQNSDPVEAPTATGILQDGALTIDPNQATTANTLDFDTNAPAGGGPTTAPPIVSTRTPVITVSASRTPTPTATSTEPSNTVEASGGSSRPPIALSTVIGSCVGAFIGATALICLGFWFYRRYTRLLKYRKSRDPLNTRGDLHRRRSRREPWDKLEDDSPEDKWEGQTKQAATEESVAPMEKLTIFKSTPSIRTAYTHSEDTTHFEIPHPFAQYPNTNRSQTNFTSNDNSSNSLPAPTPFTSQDDNSAHVFSWDDAAKGSFLTVRTHSDRLSGAMSPTLNMAIPTPPATASSLHHWESAEIINLDGQSAEVVGISNDDSKTGERRKSISNPFFGAHEDIPKRRSRSNSIASRSRTNSVATSIYIPVPRLDKGKGRATDPFNDDHAHTRAPPPPTLPTIITSTPAESLPLPRPSFSTHNPTGSNSSVSSNERALASLLAALDGDATEEEVQTRLRIASMQPSISSVYSEGDGEEDVTKDFPLPPQSTETLTPTVESYVTAVSDRTMRT